MTNLYQHTGRGHWIGSCCIVMADDIEEAKKIITEWLIKTGLPNEPLCIMELSLQKGVIYENNGDY